MKLPVIQTCDMCSEYVVRAADGSGRCVHLRLGGDVLGASPPPSWCPLRTGPDAERIAALEADRVKAQEAIGNGTDDSRWQPGETAVDALIRERDEARSHFARLRSAAYSAARSLICGHQICGCTKHRLLAALKELP